VRTSNPTIQEEIKIRLNSWNACYNPVQNILFLRIISVNKDLNTQPVILSVVLYGCKTWSLILREKLHGI
jgi:hypothetical protein